MFGALVGVSVGTGVFVCVEIASGPAPDETHPTISSNAPNVPQSSRGLRFLCRGEHSHGCVVGRGPLDSRRRGNDEM